MQNDTTHCPESEYSQEFLDVVKFFSDQADLKTVDQFIERMKRSMAVSFHKYGPVRAAYPHKVDALASLRKRLRLYQDTGNADYLTDVANFAMIEYMCPKFDDAKRKAEIFTGAASYFDEAIVELLEDYEESHNLVAMIQIAGMAQYEDENPTHPDYHFAPTDGGEGRYWHAGGRANELKNDGARQ